MNEKEKLEYYLEKIRNISRENLTKENTSAIQALKEALEYVESEMIGY